MNLSYDKLQNDDGGCGGGGGGGDDDDDEYKFWPWCVLESLSAECNICLNM